MVSGLDVCRWDGPGYRPLVLSEGWMVAWLNWEPPFDLENLGEAERHLDSDEVFVLFGGRAVLATWTDSGEFAAADMAAGTVYNVRAGTWHSLLATRDAAWVIVEKRGTDLNDTHLRQLTAKERSELLAGLPAWVAGAATEAESHGQALSTE